MGIVIGKHKVSHDYRQQISEADSFATDASGRLVPKQGELFERMPLGSLKVIAFMVLGNSYRQNPYTAQGMRWEVSFSESRLCFYSPETNRLRGGVAERSGMATMGFYFYNELRSLSLGSAQEHEGPYVSMTFVIAATKNAQIPIGVRVHGSAKELHAFATMLAARTVERYAQVSSVLALDTTDLEMFFEEVNGFDYFGGAQTDLFISATENNLRVSRELPQDQWY